MRPNAILRVGNIGQYTHDQTCITHSSSNKLQIQLKRNKFKVIIDKKKLGHIKLELKSTEETKLPIKREALASGR